MNFQAVNRVSVNITVVLGRTHMPVRQLLKMGRGAVIELDANVDDPAWILVNNAPIARGDIVVTGEHVGISITDTIEQ